MKLTIEKQDLYQYGELYLLHIRFDGGKLQTIYQPAMKYKLIFQ